MCRVAGIVEGLLQPDVRWVDENGGSRRWPHTGLATRHRFDRDSSPNTSRYFWRTNKPMHTTPADQPLTLQFNEAKEYAANLEAHGHKN